VPGAVIVGGTIVTWPSLKPGSEVGIAVLVLMAPVVGYASHQLFRVLFEMTGGFGRSTRTVLRELPGIVGCALDQHEAFLVWEIAFYDTSFPQGFREHDKRSWHFILSFWGVTCAVALVLASEACRAWLHPERQSSSLFVLGAVGVGMMFWAKGQLTFNEVTKQEVALARHHASLFKSIASSLRAAA